MKILFLVPYPLGESPSQRFRFEQYFELLKKEGYQFNVQSFLSSANWRVFFSSGNGLQKVLALLAGMAKRLLIFLHLPFYNFIFIHRETAPLGPPAMEWLIAKIFHKRIIYDFDDAIWLTDRPDEGFIFAMLKCRRKVAAICRWSFKVSCGNRYLCEYAHHYNTNVVLNPTTIDTELLHNPALYQKKRDTSQIIIGWTGSHSTLKYLNLIEPALQEIMTEFPQVSLVVIADKPPSLKLINVIFKTWSEKTEIADLAQFYIGIMPLSDDEWARGKCGFKALQYMAMEIPSVVSPVGVNTTIVQHEIDGFIAANKQEWTDALRKLIIDRELALEIGKSARKKVIQNYSVKANTANFLALFA